MKKKIKLAALIGIMTALLAQTAAFAAAEEATTPTYDIILDGTKLALSSPPFLQNGATMVPFRTVFERIGLRVSWNAKTKQVTGSNAEREIVFTLGSKVATVNGKAETMLLAPVIKNDTTYIPLRFVGTASGGAVELYRGGLNVVWMLSAIQNELYQAVVAQNTAQVEKLLARGADPEVLVGPLGPAIFAFVDDSVDIAQLFIKHGMDINAKSADYSGYTLLHNAAANGRVEVVKFLLTAGADHTIKSGTDSTALELAEFWREQLRYGYMDNLPAKRPTISDYDTIIALLKEYMGQK
ncbi:stalk domain-containing protein [Paenibacillus spongiae]|uniref:Ankyrin repeat domain-containing protein n=1 Tax=Paenibacillus spongiae TaxID=2909671 RepID=A0ABY5S8X0_9BACL|nr:stalk domain-containing protein [Paenibacillus spongiae]UVI29963.1 ankyrin repeat domain-containing protein [Paenibacillus spongiae]